MMRPIDAEVLLAMLYESVEECQKIEEDARKFGAGLYYTGRATAFCDILSFVERMKPYQFDGGNSALLHNAAKTAMSAYNDHIAAGGKGDPAEECWIEALGEGALAITALKTLEERYAQAVAERDAVNKDRINLHEQLNAALQDLRKADMVDCCHCKHYKVNDANECAAADCTCDDCKRDCPCKTCKNNSNWEWRGVQHD